MIVKNRDLTNVPLSLLSLIFFSPSFVNPFSQLLFRTAQDLCIYFSALWTLRAFFFFLQFKFAPCIFGHGYLFGGSVLLARDPSQIFLITLWYKCSFTYPRYTYTRIHPQYYSSCDEITKYFSSVQ